MLTPEIDSITNQILAGMGVPNEFVFGGLQWSGASVSLRMLENQFINYRTMMQRMLDWIVEQIATYFGYPPISVKMQNFKMADDVAQKQLIITLAQSQVISNQTMLTEIMPEVDYTVEREKIKDEQLFSLKMQADVQRAQSAGGLMSPMAQMGQQQQAMQPGTPQQLPEKNPPRAQGANQQI
jgi:hypothetical protein